MQPLRAVAHVPTTHLKAAAGGAGGSWMAATLPASAYRTDEPAVPTVAMATSLGFRVSVVDDVVYAITSVICDHADRVRQIHPAAQSFAPTRAHLQGHGPLHPGAARYFQGKGIPVL